MNVKNVITDDLNIGYEEHGDSEGFPVILLHGFPYDIRSWDKVIPFLIVANPAVINAAPSEPAVFFGVNSSDEAT